MNDSLLPVNMLEWYVSAGVDEVISETPVNRFEIHPVPQTEKQIDFRPSVNSAAEHSVGSVPHHEENESVKSLLENISSLEELKNTMLNFEGSPLKNTASNMVFGMGAVEAKVMIIGEAPGAEEDRQGLPFVGVSGQLLDLMLQSIGLNREQVYISNILPWRPPANRKPSEDEIALFSPFIRKHIALVNPQTLLLLGGSAVSALMHLNEGITRCRGRWMIYEENGLSIPTIASFHPAFLLRTPIQKKMAWRDLLSLKQKIS